MDENHLISLLKQQDESAFKELFKQFETKIFNTALSILQNNEDAEDVSQEIFIEVFQSVHQFKGESKLSTWVYRIAVTKSLEFLRKKKAGKRFAFMQSLFGIEGLPEKDSSLFYHPGVRLENKERSAILFQAINKLPEQQRVAFILNKVDGFSYLETSEIMVISVSSVESLMFRARQKLQKLLSDYYEQNEK